jgi:hypothetical protein
MKNRLLRRVSQDGRIGIALRKEVRTSRPESVGTARELRSEFIWQAPDGSQALRGTVSSGCFYGSTASGVDGSWLREIWLLHSRRRSEDSDANNDSRHDKSYQKRQRPGKTKREAIVQRVDPRADQA